MPAIRRLIVATTLLGAVILLTTVAPQHALAQTSPVVEFLGQKFYVTLGGMEGSQCVAFDPLHDEVISVNHTTLCGGPIKAGIPEDAAAWDPVSEDFWYITANREVFAYNGNVPVLQFQIPETFNVPGVGADTLENPFGLAIDMNHVYVMDAGPNLGDLESNAWFKFDRSGTPVKSSKATGLTAALQPHFDSFGDAIVDGMTWIPDDAPYGQGLFLVAIEHSGILVLDAEGEAVDQLLWEDQDLPYGEAVPFAFAGIAIDPNTGDLYLVENAGAAMHVWIRLDPTEGQVLVYNVFGNNVVFPDLRCRRRMLIPTQSNQFSLTYRDVDGLLWTNEFNSGEIITIDPRSGKQTSLGLSGVNDVWGMAHDTERDVVYMMEHEFPSDSGRIHVLDPNTVMATPLPIASGIMNDIAFNSDDGYIYGVKSNGIISELVRVDRDTGVAAVVSTLPVSGALAFERLDGVLVLLGGNPRTLYVVNPDNGFTVPVAPMPSGIGFEGLAAVSIPAEPVVSVPLQRPAQFTVRALPNPSPGASRFDFTLPSAGHVTARIVDVTGRTVRTMADARWFEAGPGTLRWDGRASDGTPVGAGVYFVVLTRGSERGVARFAVVR